ncbi:MAG: creatininase family protein [Armatimonadetes bacterium]|nr:creatininase family protein [Armatimonadota bacterium]
MPRFREVRWEHMFQDELNEAFEECPAVWFPYGLCEPHGPHNAIGLDALKAHAVCCRAAQLGGGIVAPADFWHCHESGGYAVWGHRWIGQARTFLTCLPPWQHFKNVAYHIRQAAAHGFHAAVFLTGHYGPNWEDLKTLLDLLQPHFAMRLYGLPDFECNQPGFDGDGASGDHAGKVETSLLWALEPDGVDMNRLPAEGDPSGAPWFAMGPNAREADRLIGARMAEDEAAWLVRKMRDLMDDYGDRQPTRLSFGQLEALWREVVEPALPTFRTMQDDWGQTEGVPAESQWAYNWRIGQ